ncbi:histone-fold-containing protein [Mycena albidolilacea]|uniref:Histone-fold-containing protein n=1 Tax=Mycena albidolilacea TaxID=1033008 RepID=A0AAD7E9L4_9AGAR|nr:histone-fold-containing protein [Mycena albidolilacea]
MACNKVSVPSFAATLPLIGRRKQTFRKSTGGKCSPYSTLADTDYFSLPGNTPIVHLPCMTPLRQATQPKTRRRPAGIVAVCEIHKYQKDTSLLIPKTSFQCLVKEITKDYQPDVQFQSLALLALQEAAEDYLVAVFEDSMQVAQHTHRETIQSRDMVLVLRLRGDSF